VRQTVGNHRVVPIDDCGKPVVVPQQIPLRLSLVLFLDDKAHTRIVALVLEAPQAPALALEAHPAGLAQAHSIEGAGLLPGGIGSHAAQMLLSYGEHGVVELPPRFQVSAHACGLPCRGFEGQLEHKRRRLLFGRGALLCLLLAAHGPHLCLKIERLFQF
jgi:hypothetical protein